MRLIRFASAFWDTEPVARQEAVFGRRKADGAPLGHDREDAAIDDAADPTGRVIALESHIRMANPRTAVTEGSQIPAAGLPLPARHRPLGARREADLRLFPA